MSEDREFLRHSLRLLAEKIRQGQDPDAHPSVEDLIAYHAGELSEGGATEIQRHLGICHECPELVLALDGFSDPPDGEPGIPPAGIDSAWEEIRQRLAAEGWFRGGAKRAPWSWAALFPPRRLAAVVAVVVIAFGVFLIHGPAERLPRIVDEQGASSLQWELRPAARSEPQEIGDAASAKGFTLVASPDGRWSFPEYRVELWKGSEEPGLLLWSGGWHPKSPFAPFFLRLPRGYLPADAYRLDLYGVEGGRRSPKPEDRRRFLLSYN